MQEKSAVLTAVGGTILTKKAGPRIFLSTVLREPVCSTWLQLKRFSHKDAGPTPICWRATGPTSNLPPLHGLLAWPAALSAMSSSRVRSKRGQVRRKAECYWMFAQSLYREADSRGCTTTWGLLRSLLFASEEDKTNRSILLSPCQPTGLCLSLPVNRLGWLWLAKETPCVIASLSGSCRVCGL